MIRECPSLAAGSEAMALFEVATAGSVRLSPREFLLVSLAAVGLTDKEIAIRIQISLPTVKTYWQRVRLKFGAANRAQCVGRFRDVYQIAPIADEDVSGHIEDEIEPVIVAGDLIVEDGGGELQAIATELSPLLSELDAAAWLGTDRTGLRRYRREGRLSCSLATRVYARAQVQALALELEREILGG